MKQTQGFSTGVVIAIVAVVLVGGAAFFTMNKNSENKEAQMAAEKMKMEEKMTMEKEAMMEKEKMVADEAMMKKEDGVMSADKKMEVGKAGDTMETEADSMMKKDDEAMMKKEGSAMMDKVGVYTTYSGNTLAMAQKGRTVLFFHASWCPTCRTADADIVKNLSAIPAGVTILKTDYDTEVALKQKYGVTSQHTFVEIDSKGVMVQKWSGGNFAGITAKL